MYFQSLVFFGHSDDFSYAELQLAVPMLEVLKWS